MDEIKTDSGPETSAPEEEASKIDPKPFKKLGTALMIAFYVNAILVGIACGIVIPNKWGFDVDPTTDGFNYDYPMYQDCTGTYLPDLALPQHWYGWEISCPFPHGFCASWKVDSWYANEEIEFECHENVDVPLKSSLCERLYYLPEEISDPVDKIHHHAAYPANQYNWEPEFVFGDVGGDCIVCNAGCTSFNATVAIGTSDWSDNWDPDDEGTSWYESDFDSFRSKETIETTLFISSEYYGCTTPKEEWTPYNKEVMAESICLGYEPISPRLKFPGRWGDRYGEYYMPMTAMAFTSGIHFMIFWGFLFSNLFVQVAACNNIRWGNRAHHYFGHNVVMVIGKWCTAGTETFGKDWFVVVLGVTTRQAAVGLLLSVFAELSVFWVLLAALLPGEWLSFWVLLAFISCLCVNLARVAIAVRRLVSGSLEEKELLELSGASKAEVEESSSLLGGSVTSTVSGMFDKWTSGETENAKI